MEKGIIRYYYFLDDDYPAVEGLLSILGENGFAPRDLPGANLSGTYEVLDFSNMKGLALEFYSPGWGWEETLQQLQGWEKTARLRPDHWLFKVNILVATDEEWSDVLNEAGTRFATRDPLVFPLGGGTLGLLSRSRGQAEATYLAVPGENDQVTWRFLRTRLAHIESRLVELQLLSRLFKERESTVAQEKEELEKKLSGILHRQLVSQPGEAEVLELEGQLDALSASYGMIVGDYNSMADGYSRLRRLLDLSHRQLTLDPALTVTPEQLARITGTYHQQLADLQQLLTDLQSARENHKAAIDVVRSKIEILNSRSNIATQEQIKNIMQINTQMQKQSLIFQYAAGLIEFIVLAYYSHSLWSHLAHAAYTAIPGWIQFIVVMLFSGATVYCTHLLAEYRQGDSHVRPRLILTSLVLFFIFLVILLASFLMAGHH